MYVRLCDCRMDEAEVGDLSTYPTLAAFFNRSLKSAVRPISDADLVCSSFYVQFLNERKFLIAIIGSNAGRFFYKLTKSIL